MLAERMTRIEPSGIRRIFARVLDESKRMQVNELHSKAG